MDSQNGNIASDSLHPSNRIDKKQEDDKKEKIEGRIYKDYLQLDNLLSNVDMMRYESIPRMFYIDVKTLFGHLSEKHGKPVHDEHLFIVIHQTYELWFKQMIWELDSVRSILNVPIVSEKNMLTILQRMNRIAMIWHIAVEQFPILETMTPLDFMDFRCYLAPGSGFQSLQFRIIENKLGQKMEQRVNQHSLIEAFQDADSKARLERSLQEPSLCDLLNKWLERTPGLELEGFDFAKRYAEAAQHYLNDERAALETETDPEKRSFMEAEWKKQKDTFESLLIEDNHNERIRMKERRLSYRAMMGALIVSCYSENPRFHLPHQFLTTLMDIDSLMTKWRYNHVMLAQRMLGSSSGYMYLRSTVSDRYKVFLDLFNISSFIIPRNYFPALTNELKISLNSDWGTSSVV